MNYEKLVQGILNIGEAMLQCGAEIFRVEDSLYRMYKSYGFMTYDVYVIPSNIQVTVETPEGEITLDVTGRKNGRGAYVCFSKECLHKAIKNKGLERSLKMQIPQEVYENLERELDTIEL